jgi:hypothetical protein
MLSVQGAWVLFCLFHVKLSTRSVFGSWLFPEVLSDETFEIRTSKKGG